MNLSNEVLEKIERVYDMFESSFIYKDEELILHKKWNIYFRLLVDLYPEKEEREITTDEFDYKLLSYLSFYCASHHEEKSSEKCKWSWDRINRWFKREFSYNELQKIYQRLGAGANMSLGIKFIKSNFDMSLLQT